MTRLKTPAGACDCHMHDDTGLLDLLLDWAPHEKTRDRILAANPAEHYGFASNQ